MRNKKLGILLTVSLVALTLVITPTEALAVPIQSLNGQTGVTQTFQNDSNVTISSSNNTHSLGWLGLLPLSRGGTGAGSFTLGSLLFSNGTSIAEDNSNLFWDNTNKRLGVDTNAPSGQLHLGGIGQAVTDNYGLLIDDKTAGTNNYNIWSGSPISAFDPPLNSGEPIFAQNVFASLNYPGTTGLFISQDGDAVALQAAAVSTAENGPYSGWFTADSLAPSGTYIREMASGYFRSSNIGAGTVGSMDGILIDSADPTNGGGSTESSTGIEIRGPGNGIRNVAISTNIGAGDNNFALNNIGNAKSYFGGKVGIKTQNPDASLDVVGSIKGDSTIILGNSTTPACIEAADSDGSGVSYITVNDGVISASTTKPSFCQ